MPTTIGDILKFKEEQRHPAKKEKLVVKWLGKTECDICKTSKSRF